MVREKIISLILLLGIFFFVGRQIALYDFSSSYDLLRFQTAYEGSQYTGGSGTIPDHIVFLYAAGAYIKGANPLKINPEMPPLGKYLLGISILFFNNTSHIIVLFTLLTLLALYLLALALFGKTHLALIPVFLFSSEKLFLNQLRVIPMLDILQLPFIFLSIYFFYRAVTTKMPIFYLICGLMLGFVVSIKVLITGVLLVSSWVLLLLIKKDFFAFIRLVFITFPAAIFVLLISYIRIFVDGSSLWDFFLVQKWILSYQRSKLMFPLSAWRLLFLNQWQAWWGDYSIIKAEDWRVTWPIITFLSLSFILIKLYKKAKWKNLEAIIALWIIVYSVFISSGTISTRHFLPFIPFLYLISLKFILMIQYKLPTFLE